MTRTPHRETSGSRSERLVAQDEGRRGRAALVAKGLASAFLAGDWKAAELVSRARHALADRPIWLGALARAVMRSYREAPRDRRDELAGFVAGHPLFVSAFEPPGPAPRIVRVIADDPAMGPSPWPVPELATLGDLATFLRLRVEELDWFADRRGLERFAPDEALRHYVYRWWRKPSGGVRVLEAPKSRLKALQRRVLHEILDAIPANGASHGFVRGRSTLSFAAPHVGQQVVVRIDLEDFFASVRAARVFGIFRTAGYPESVARSLTALCTNRVAIAWWRGIPRPGDASGIDAHWRLGRRLATPHLPQGAPTSPALANLAAHRLDKRLFGLARSMDVAYTRYADDLAFSGSRFGVRSLVNRVSAIAADEGFVVRAEKTRVRSQASRQLLAGWVVNRGTNVPRSELDRLEAILVNCARRGPAAENRANHRDFRGFLAGKIAWVRSARPDRAERLDQIFRTLDWT